MAEQLPPTYWDDISRHCGQLLASAAVERIKLPHMRVDAKTAVWDAAAEDTTAILTKSVVCSFGLYKWTQHRLSLKSHITGIVEDGEYAIVFNPKKRIIKRASSQLEFKVPEDAQEDYAKTIEYMKYRLRDAARMEELGLHIPGPEDYDLLLSELQRGVTPPAT
jgi:hypothetical protein